MDNPEEKTMLLDEGSGLEAPDSGNAKEIGSLYTADGELPEHLLAHDDAHDEEGVTGNEAESVMQEDSEMAEPVGEETEADSAALEQPDATNIDHSEEPMDTNEAISTTGDFLSETKALIVEGEPPQQLMEEADAPVEENTDEDLVGTSGIEESSDVPATAADEAMFAHAEDESQEPLQEQAEEGILLDQEGEQAVLDSLQALSQGAPLVSGVMGETVSQGNNENTTEMTELPAEDMAAESTTDAGEATELPEGSTIKGAEEGSSGFTILASGDNLGTSLGDLDGKLVVNADGTVHLLTGHEESLQGMQLMEGDDKPEEEADGEQSAAQIQENIRAQLHEALMKQEEIKQEQQEQQEQEDGAPPSQPITESDALATLASAALDHQTPSNGVKTEETAEVKSEGDEPQWMDVGICKGTHCMVRTFFVPNEGQAWDKNWQGVTTSTLPDHRALAKLELEAGKAYKFRVAAINSCGRGPWSEIAAFRTSMPGVPSAPSSIKISKTTEGAHLTWDPPTASSGPIADYTVYMAVRKATTDSQVVSSGATQLAFVRIYQGAENQCSVGFETLSEAHIDGGAKPAILFRIAARNEKGLGPAIQVRWLQDGAAAVNSAKPAPAVAPRRVGPEIKPHTNIKRLKGEND